MRPVTIEDRIRAMDPLDVAGLLGDERNELRSLVRKGAEQEARRRLIWWEEALGVDMERINEVARRALTHPDYLSLAQDFVRREGHRRKGLALLRAAVHAGDRSTFARRKCLARAYAWAAVQFLEHLAQAVLLAEHRTSAEEARHAVAERNYPVLQAHLQYRLAAGQPVTNYAEVQRELHQIGRSQQVLGEIVRRERERDELVEELSALIAELPEAESVRDRTDEDRQHLRRRILETQLAIRHSRNEEQAVRVANAARHLQEKLNATMTLADHAHLHHGEE